MLVPASRGIPHWFGSMELQRRRGDLTVAATRSATSNDGRVIETSIPFRLDALRWSGFHTRVVMALGITWILDGLEVTLAGALSGALKQSPTLHFSNLDVGFANSAYLAGAVLGALGFGWLTDRIGRRKLFFITLVALSGGYRGHGVVVERRKLCGVPVSDRRRHRRRIHGDQFDHPGTGAGALSRMDRPCDQRQFLDRRCAGRGERHLAARSASAPVPISAGGSLISPAPASVSWCL